MKLKTISTIALFTIAIAACKKKDNNTTTPLGSLPPKEKLLIGNWALISGETIETNSQSGTKTYSVIDDCEKDDVYGFTSDKHYTADDGANKCTPTYTNGSMQTWSITNDSTLYGFEYFNGQNSSFPTIVTLNNTTLQLKISYSYSTPTPNPSVLITDNTVTTFTFKRK